MEFLIITGLSGAGKSRAADVLEDLDFYCVDNMPAALIPRFAELCMATKGRYEKVALVMDVRERDGFAEILSTLDRLEEMEFDYKILYMDADVRTLVRRYKETRRPHPLSKAGGSIEDAIRREVELLAPVKERADFVVNSSSLTLGMLQNRLFTLFASEGHARTVEVNVMSFGYKHGIPMDADLVFDVRFLPNPFYDDDLRTMCGLDKPVKDFVFGYQQTRDFMDKLTNMVDFLLPLYAEEGKLSVNIAVGCTGGHHRSVAMAEALCGHLQKNGVNASSTHRDLDK